MNTWELFGKGQRINENNKEVDYDDDYQDMVRRVGEKAKAADALKAQGKQPQTKFNPKTGKYYVDFGQDKEVKENAEELNVGDPVIITGDVEFNGKTGDIAEFGRDKRFVVVNLYNYGKHSFHSSDVEYNDHADLDEAGYGRNRGYTPGFASPHAPALGGRRHREDDEGWEQERQAQSVTWYIRVNGKIIKDKMGVPYQYRGKEAATKAARTMMAKPFNAGKKFMLTTNPVDDQPENEAVLHTQYKHNRFKAVRQRDQEQDRIANMAMDRVHNDVEEGRMVKGPGGVPLDRQGRPVVAKAKPLSMRKWLVVHDGSHGEGGKDIIEAPNAETAWETANEYDLNIISITPYRGPARPTLVDEGVAEGWDPDTTRLEQDVRDALENGDDYTAKQYAKMAPTPEAKKYLLNIIKQAMYIDDLGGETDWKGVAEGMKADELSRYCEELVAEKGWDAAYKHAKFMAQGNTDPSWGSVLRYLQSMKDGMNEAGSAAQQAAIAINMKKHNKKPKDVDEGWKSAVGGAALAGAMALGGSAHAQSGEDFLPDIVAHVTFRVDGNTVTKDINLGNNFKSPGEASAVLQKFLKDKGIKFYDFSIERVKPDNRRYLEKTPASDTGHSGSMDSGPYSASGSSSDYMAKESIDEAIDRAVLSMMEDGYEFTEEKVRLDPKCWKGKKIGNPKTKMKGGVRVNNCVPQ